MTTEQTHTFVDDETLRKIYVNEHVEAFKAVFEFGKAAIRIALVLNGGAAIALLAFLGNALGKGVQLAMMPVLWALGCYLAGAALSSLVAGASYLSQGGYMQEFWKGQGRTFDSGRLQWGSRFNKVAVLLFMAAIVFFAAGCLLAACAMIRLFPGS